MRRRSHRLLAGLLAGCLAGPASAGAGLPFPAPCAAALGQAGPRNLAIEAGRERIESGEFELAVKTLQGGLSEPDVTENQLVELLQLLGLAQLYLGKEEQARDAFEKLLQARPDFELPRSEPPKIRALYARIKDDIKKRRVLPITLTSSPIPEKNAGDQPLELAVHIENLGLGAKAKLYYRRSGGQSFSSVDFVRQPAPDEFRATIPAYELPTEPRAYEMDYYLEVADAAQRRLAGRGDPYNPLTFRVLAREDGPGPAVEESSWYQSPWIWAGIGVVAAGAAAGIVVVATQKQTGTLPITIKVDGAP